MPAIGYSAQVLALVLAIYTIVVAVIGARRNRQDLILSAKNAALGVTFFLTVAVGVMVYLLVTQHYQTEYVASVTNRDATMFFRVSALWGSQNGSLLVFAWFMSIFSSAVLLSKWGVMKSLIPYVMAVINAVLAFFIGLVVTVANPFTQLSFVPADGQGMNPMLYHWGMVIHPPILYIGFVAFVVPFAFAIAAMITGQRSDLWMRTTRRWSLVAWVFLSMGLLLGGRWAYDVLGWGGYWGWDAVESAALIPWLVATPFLLSVIIQEYRGMMKRWNMALIILTFALVIEGTSLTRSGVIGSVHTFAQSAIGPLFLSFIGIMFIASLALFVYRWDMLEGENELDSVFSREAIFLLNNLLFMAVAFTVWWGTHFPIISEAILGEKIVVGPPFFRQAVGPLFAAIVLLMGIAPLMPWRHVTSKRLVKSLTVPTIIGVSVMIFLYVFTWIKMFGAVMTFGFIAFSLSVIIMEFWRGIQARRRKHDENIFVALGRLTARNRRRYGGYLIHIGVLLTAIGIIGMEFYQVETQQNVARGESFSISSPFVGTYDIKFINLETVSGGVGIQNTEATVQISRNGKVVDTLVPYRELFVRQQQPMTIPDIHREWTGHELYVIVAGWEPDGQSASFKAYINPLINWLWGGGIVFILGTLVAAWPASEMKQKRVKTKVDNNRVKVS